MIYLRFNTSEDASSALLPEVSECSSPIAKGEIAVDIVGEIFNLDERGEKLPSRPGFHVNLSERVPSLVKYEIEAPKTPSRVFYGY